MKNILAFLIAVFCAAPFVSHANSFGKRLEGRIVSVSGQPAICLPTDPDEDFLLGWVAITESYLMKPPAWGLEFKGGDSPLLLKGGDCIIFGVALKGYESDVSKDERILKVFEVGKIYRFRLSNWERPTDSYGASFCVCESSYGTLLYRQCRRPTGGGVQALSCCTESS